MGLIIDHKRNTPAEGICVGIWGTRTHDHQCGKTEHHLGDCQCWCGARTKIEEEQ